MAILWLLSQTSFFQPKNQLPFSKGPHHCEGRVVSAPAFVEGATVLVVEVVACAAAPEFDWKPSNGKVRLKVLGNLENLYEGDSIRFRSSFHLPRDFKNPGSFKITRYYHSKGIAALGFIGNPNWVVRLPLSEARKGWLQKIREKIRGDVLTAMSAEAGGADAGAFILSLLIADRWLLSEELNDVFQRSGVAHILSISGLHVTLVSLIFLMLFRVIASLPPFSNSIFVLRFYPWLVVVPVWFYVALASFPVSAVRAAIMASLVLVALSLWERLDLLSVLALAAFLILAVSPLSFYSASFQLSFVAVLFLILFFPHWRRFRGRFWILDLFGVSLICLLGVTPLLLFHFHTFGVVGLLSNAVVVPLVNFGLMPGCLLGIVFPSLWPAVGWVAGAILKIVVWFAEHSEWGIFYGAISFWQLAVYYGTFFLFLLPKQTLSRKWKLATAALLMAVVWWGGQMPASGKLKITFVDVGQGDCAVVKLPNGKVWVIDGGGIRGSDFDVGRFIVAPFLWETGIHRVDYLFLSHPHHDHYKGLGFLAEKFGPKFLFENGDSAPEAEGEEWDDFLKRVDREKVERKKVTRDTKPLEESGVRVEFLTPSLKGTIPHFDPNDNSVVVRLTYKDVSFLFPGDLMKAGELQLLGSKPNLKADVLKVGHHGSETSTTEDFLRAVAPKYAVISVGEFNSYGMPDQTVIDRLQKKGVQIFRTDRHGAVTFETDGKSIEVKTFVPVVIASPEGAKQSKKSPENF